MKQSELPPLVITMAAEALIAAEEAKQPINDTLLRRVIGRHGPFERGSFGYHLRTVQTVCRRPTKIVQDRRKVLEAQRAQQPSLF